MKLTKTLTLTLASALTGCLVAGTACGERHSDAGAQSFASIRRCLETAGFTPRRLPRSEIDYPIAKRGALQGRFPSKNDWLVFLEPTAEAARRTEQLYASGRNQNWPAGVRLRQILKRAGNAVVAYGEPPSRGTSRRLERCLGEAARLDPAVGRRFDPDYVHVRYAVSGRGSARIRFRDQRHGLVVVSAELPWHSARLAIRQGTRLEVSARAPAPATTDGCEIDTDEGFYGRQYFAAGSHTCRVRRLL